MTVPRLSSPPSLPKPPEAHIRDTRTSPHELKRFIDKLAEDNIALRKILDEAVAVGSDIARREEASLGRISKGLKWRPD
jgi:hypothetical protein